MTTSSTARQPKGSSSGGQFAPSAHAEPSLNLNTADMLDTEAGRQLYAFGLAADVEEASLKLQSVYMIDAASELHEDWPEIREFTLGEDPYRGDRIAVVAATNMDGTDLSEAELWSASDVFRYRDMDDYDRKMGRPINVQDAIAWRPGTDPTVF